MKIEELKNKIKKSPLAKGKYNVLKTIIAVVLAIAIATTLVLIKPTKIWDRLPIFAVAICFVLIHLIFRIKDIYEIIYKKRYILAAVFMLYVVVMGYSGSSIATYSQVIQAEYQEKNYTPILGNYRSIRSDEWSIGTPVSISQGNGENRYQYYSDKLRGTPTDVLSVVGAPVLDITILGKPFNIGYIILGSERGLSFLWYGKIVMLMLASFEFFMLITNKKKVASAFGMILITFSAATQWWSITDVMMWGMTALVLIDKFMLTDKLKTKILCSIGIAICGISYVFVFYPAWQVPFAFIYLAVLIWIIWKNRKVYKMTWKDVLMVVLVIMFVVGILVHYYINSKEALSLITGTSYPGERFELGGGESALKVMFSYVYSMLFPYIGINNPCEYSGMLSLYPVPMILAIIYLIRNRKKEDLMFLIPMLIVSVMLSVWTLMVTNRTFAKLTLLYMSPSHRTAIPLGVIQIIFMVYVIARCKKEDKILGENIALCLSTILSIVIMKFAIQTDFDHVMGNLRAYICGLIVFVCTYWLLTLNKENNKEKLIILLVGIALVTGVTVHPIQKGISVITTKPIAKEVQKIVEEDENNSLWIVDSTTFYIPNYFLANGARVINSTNAYPNFELYKTVLGEDADKEEIKNVYNRYAHLNIEITKDNNQVELLFMDSIKLYITTEKLKELGIKYVVSTRNLEEYNTDEIEYEKLYGEYGLNIYQLEY